MSGPNQESKDPLEKTSSIKVRKETVRVNLKAPPSNSPGSTCPGLNHPKKPTATSINHSEFNGHE